jgi:ferredoxin
MRVTRAWLLKQTRAVLFWEVPMASAGYRFRKNEWGRYYVTDECDGCGICASYAPCNFESSTDGSYYYIIQQPYDEEEASAVKDAISACPRHCIRDDGDTV